LKLPNADAAIIDADKLHGYLLSREHPVGRFKASYFRTLGYSDKNWAQFESDLRKFHLSEDVSEVVGSPYGAKYVIRANLKGPNGETAELVSVWIILTDEDIPRFVTAYPGEG
jgi:hypothetical protein